MKKRSRVLCGVLALTMVAGMLSGCGKGMGKEPGKETGDTQGKTAASDNETKSADAKEITFWMFQENAEYDFFKKYVDLYNEENPDVHVKMEQIPWEDYNGTKMATAFASGTGPDVFLVAPGLFLKYANSDILAIPFEMEFLGLYYNKQALEEVNMEAPKTWNEMYDAAKALTTDTRSGLTFETVKGTHQLFEWYPFLWQTDNDVFNEEKTAAKLNQPGVIENLELKRKMLEEGSANLKPSRNNTEIGILADGETAMQINGSWAITKLEQEYPDFIDHVGLVPLPVPEGGHASTVAGGWKVCANANSKYPKEAAKFAAWLFADDASHAEEWCTEVKFAYSPRKSVVENNSDIYQKGLRSVFTNEIFGTEKAEKRLPAEISTILQDLLQAAYFDTSTDITEEVIKAENKINEFLAGYDGEL
ncbi:MAG: sugar ABC transporter substrate-binding protein [Clostridiales bacterium]|nr:sugar ABC transporter substrate-binding protein [Clostridiales bacterium]MDU3242241.1 sugar ABC transporter substrate-binding protein [Clostridiales bacterium]